MKNKYNYIILISLILLIPELLFAADTTTTQKEKLKTSLTMEETRIEGEVEKPEFISIIQRRRVEFKKKGELNVSFKDNIFEPVEREKFEDNYSRKFNKVLDTGSVTAR